jgi:valyl-tRNA synthetase
MDEGFSKAVTHVFVELWKRKLLYRDKRLVNWDPRLQTAISDLEVEQREVKGHLWHFKYPLEGEEGRFIVVATTRPETMLGDSGVAVHPDDPRYQDLIGKYAILPIVGRKLRIVADDYADPETGSGAVKITPAHDFNDFEVGRRHDLERINIFDADAKLNEYVPEAYRGLDRYDARKKIVDELEALGLLEKIEDRIMTIPYGDRGGVVIEPWLTDQWYVDAATLAKPAIEAVEQGRTQFVPEQWTKTYFEWMRNIQPWCISRQLWWGHQIPAWYGPDGKVFVAEEEAAAKAEAKKHYGKDVSLERDEDVLDTWFSSGLWPFSTLGWPEETDVLKRHYPNDVLVTGFDIIFFWVARMMMMGLHFMKDVPFRTVYIHALVRDQHGQKMSKSKGNIIDPLELIDKYGADALRFTLAALAAPGRDVKLAESRVEGYRNFATKLWNATRFCQMNGAQLDPGFQPDAATQKVNRWIIGRLALAKREFEAAVAGYRFNDAANSLYQFTWGQFCDWYLEFATPIFGGSDQAATAETRATAAWVLGQICHLLHPLMPFITEELWSQLGGQGELIRAHWPEYAADMGDAEAMAELDGVVRLISEIRAVRAEMNLTPAAQPPMLVQGAGETTKKRLETYGDLIRRLARLSQIDPLTGTPPKGAVQIPLEEAVFILPVADLIDVAKEKARLAKELGKVESEIGKTEKKLGNADFVAKAPPEVIEEQRERLAEAQQSQRQLKVALEKLAGL